MHPIKTQAIFLHYNNHWGDMKMEEDIKPKFEEKSPVLEKNISLSKDGKWVIIKTIRTDIVHVNYLNKVLGNG
jgi:hypothetical protein